MELLFYKISDFSDEQIEYFKSFEQKKISVQSAVAHYFAKNYISQKTGINITDIQFLKTDHGKPFFSGFNFSITHSNDFVFIAFNNSPIGIDVEAIRTINPKLTRKVLCDSEMVDDNNFDIEFLKYFTAKEAYFKFIGTGITDFKKISKNQISKSHFLSCIQTQNFILSIVD